MDVLIILGCSSMHLSGWILAVSLALITGWVLASLLSLFNVWMVVTMPGSDRFKFTNYGIVFCYFIWGVVLFRGVFESSAFNVISACMIPIVVFSHSGYLVATDRRLERAHDI